MFVEILVHGAKQSALFFAARVSEKTMIEHRKYLIEHGRIEYKPKGKSAGSYRIISLENTASIAPVPEKPKEENQHDRRTSQ
ncbi:hypothetical protein ACEQPO_07865 [Bacillus sp. SL00103]